MLDFCTLYNYDRQVLYDRYVELMKKMQGHFKVDQYDVCKIFTLIVALILIVYLCYLTYLIFLLPSCALVTLQHC